MPLLTTRERMSREADCPRCLVQVGKRCKSPGGRETATSHSERYSFALKIAGDNSVEEFLASRQAERDAARDAEAAKHREDLAEFRKKMHEKLVEANQPEKVGMTFDDHARVDRAVVGLRLARLIAGSEQDFMLMLARWIVSTGADMIRGD